MIGDTTGSTAAAAPIRYGAPKPPTVEEKQQERHVELAQAERDLWDAQALLRNVVGELDRLGAPRATPNGSVLDLVSRVRFFVCGDSLPGAQPRLLAEWAPDVWSGRRRFEGGSR